MSRKRKVRFTKRIFAEPIRTLQLAKRIYDDHNVFCSENNNSRAETERFCRGINALSGLKKAIQAIMRQEDYLQDYPAGDKLLKYLPKLEQLSGQCFVEMLNDWLEDLDTETDEAIGRIYYEGKDF